MEQIIMKFFNVFVAPVLVILLPLKAALLTLGIFFLLNILIQMIYSIRKRKLKLYRIDKYIDQELIDYILKTATSYAITIVTISMFEVHLLGVQAIEMGGQIISLTRLVVILATAQQLGKMLNTVEAMTKYNLLESIISFLPQSVQQIFSKSLNKNGVLDIETKKVETEIIEIKDEEKD